MSKISKIMNYKTKMLVLGAIITIKKICEYQNSWLPYQNLYLHEDMVKCDMEKLIA